MRESFRRMLDHATSAILIGTDSPTMPARRISRAAALLRSHEMVLGPAVDGGYYLIGLTRRGFRKGGHGLFSRIRWGSPSVFRRTRAIAERLRIKSAVLAEWYDIDTAADLRRTRLLT